MDTHVKQDSHSHGVFVGDLPEATQSKILIAYISAAKALGDAFYFPESNEGPKEFSERVVAYTTDVVNFHLNTLANSHSSTVDFPWQSDAEGIDNVREISVSVLSDTLDGRASGLIEAYRSLTSERPETIHKAINLG